MPARVSSREQGRLWRLREIYGSLRLKHIIDQPFALIYSQVVLVLVIRRNVQKTRALVILASDQAV